jgi:serine phosphatase RsbU (regulator of sigma subunit)/tRNA A-37 threonylcarbamoyl transferase component Bud32
VTENNFHKQPTHPKLVEEGSFPEPLPEKIGPYKIEALLDKGGMSYLYLASHPEKGAPLTIKVLSQKFMSHPEIVQRFLNEAEIISMTDHPHIIKMISHGEWEGGLYIAMEYIEGISLRKYLLQTPLSLKRALAIILDIAYALCHLHTHGVIHRDLKPENILVTELGTIKVIDFGISQLLTEKAPTSHPQKQRWLGTPIYISPEQKENSEKVSFPSDIYSLGIIAYELILGKLSHGHIHLSLMPKGMQQILSKCLQTKSEDRYQDIVDFITDISAYLNSPSLQKEKMVGDQLSEISEELRLLQATLIPYKTQDWPGIDVGVAVSKGLNIRGVYYDFLSIDEENYGIILAESSAKGTEGFTTAAIFRGMMRALFTFTAKPIELLTILNALLIRDQLNVTFNVTYLTLSLKENLLRHISCGQGALWYTPAGKNSPEKHSSENGLLGISKSLELTEISLPFKPGDHFLFHTALHSNAQFEESFDESSLALAIKETLTQNPQQQAENILRKMRIVSGYPPLDRTQIFIALKRS